MGMRECGTGPSKGPLAAVAARKFGKGSISRSCHRAWVCLGRKSVGVKPVGATKGYGNRDFLQVSRTELRLGQTKTIGCPGALGRALGPEWSGFYAGLRHHRDGARTTREKAGDTQRTCK